MDANIFPQKWKCMYVALFHKWEVSMAIEKAGLYQNSDVKLKED